MNKLISLAIFAIAFTGCTYFEVIYVERPAPESVDAGPISTPTPVDAGYVLPTADAGSPPLPPPAYDAGPWPVDAGPVMAPDSGVQDFDAGEEFGGCGPFEEFYFCEQLRDSAPTEIFGFRGCCSYDSFPTVDYPSPGMLFKASGPHVYYMGADGKRYVFASSHFLTSWFLDESRSYHWFGEDTTACAQVVQVPDAVVASIMIGGNVPMRPGVVVTGITTDPTRRYAIDYGNVLRPIDDPTFDLNLAEPWLVGREIRTFDGHFPTFCMGAAITSVSWRGTYDGARIYSEATIQGEIDRLCGR